LACKDFVGAAQAVDELLLVKLRDGAHHRGTPEVRAAADMILALLKTTPIIAIFRERECGSLAVCPPR
jgi:hypothetical protein